MSGDSVPNWASENIDISTVAAFERDRVDYWREMILRLFADVDIDQVAVPGFHGQVKSQKCELLRVSEVSASAQAVQRRHIQPRCDDEDKYFAVLMLEGREYVQQGNNRTVLSPGEFAIYDASRPHYLQFEEDWRQVIISVPKTQLNRLVKGMEFRTATRVSLDTPAGRVFQSFLKTFITQVGRFSHEEMMGLADPAVHLMALTLGDLHPADPACSQTQALTLIRVKAFIHSNLGDPALSCEQVARATGLSTRYINKLFEREGTSLMRYVLKQRLERCAVELLSPAYAARRISELAFGLGFNDLSHFSRAFRALHGVSPSEWRAARAPANGIGP